ncbi:hypothetical protein CLV67_10419 [Actinoplanes italicus]|uniref:Uncharacterized protein n=1 Tax=Actinoplanes italicus TaxID=113567 RepID=A0A2T0KGD9_9ACTN|nr:hypothetical protein CLV67_10419 [Actinoplanes italicus]
MSWNSNCAIDPSWASWCGSAISVVTVKHHIRAHESYRDQERWSG